MSLQSIAAAFEKFAEDALESLTEEVWDTAKGFADVAKQSLEDLVQKLGQDATNFVTALINDDTLKGSEKADLAARQLVEAAGQQGIAIAGHQATTLIEAAYTAVVDKLKSSQ